ncbi:alpha/beta hydrolase [Streptomyces sp. ISL-12]|uniref:alpha/beta fold hydrolase n=1 Tax=Streptomyces sp. ISL-12 TaxID=2819177 RepID=UPI001BE8B1EC|nr:alpha/beta hydrolase [Streptomyces sp. ISL-12]MBT2409245.1 alpha/beta hydrolase [Streptomyces sp. ISL-12]
MSQLLTLEAPDNARPVRLHTERGVFAGLDVRPDGRVSPSAGTALLVPGFMGSKEDFLPLLSPLSEGGIRVVAIDNRGQYETGSASSEPSYARDDLARDLVAVVKALGTGPVHLMGHSYGGLLARAAVLATQGDPDLWASVTFMNFGPAGVSAAQQERLRLLLSVVGSMTLADMWPFVKNKEVTALPDVEEFMERRWLSNSPQQLAAAAQQMLSETDETSRLAVLSVPKFVISGTPDETWPPEGVERMARALGARFIRSEGGGHSPNVHRPAETASALLGFWRSRRETAVV